MHDVDRDRDFSRGPRSMGDEMMRRTSSQARFFFGLGLVMFGLLWTLQAMDWQPAYELVHWWPVLLVGYGVASLTGWGGTRSQLRGAFFVAAGALLLLAHLVHVYVGFGVVWALLVLFAGVVLVTRSFVPALRGGETAEGAPAGSADTLRLTAVMGAAIRRVSGQVPPKGELFAVMGGIELDLREAQPPAQPLVLDVFACAGGIELVVPETWRVESDIVPIVGGVEDRTVSAGDGSVACSVILRGTALMGGVVVRNQPGADREVTIRRRRMRREGLEEIHVSPLGVRIRRGAAGATAAAAGAPAAGAAPGTGPAPQAASADAPPPPSATPEVEPPQWYERGPRVTEAQRATSVVAEIVRLVIGLAALGAVVWLATHHALQPNAPSNATAPPPASAPADTSAPATPMRFVPDSLPAPGPR